MTKQTRQTILLLLFCAGMIVGMEAQRFQLPTWLGVAAFVVAIGSALVLIVIGVRNKRSGRS